MADSQGVRAAGEPDARDGFAVLSGGHAHVESGRRYVPWVELPAQVDAMRLHQLALEQGITIGPGHRFLIADNYRNFIRLNDSSPWSPETEQTVVTVGKLAASRIG